MHRSFIQLILKNAILAGGLFCFCCLGCEEKNDKLTEEQLINLLVDVQLAEASLKTYRPSQRDSLSIVYYQQLAKLHGLESEEILDVIRTLNDNPKELSEIYEKVVEKLNQLDAENPID